MKGEPKERSARAPWEAELCGGLDRLSDLGGEEPPNVAALQMLVLHVQQESRRQTMRDLLLFWACAAAILSGVVYAMAALPLLFVLLQVGVIIAMVMGLVVWRAQGRRVTG